MKMRRTLICASFVAASALAFGVAQGQVPASLDPMVVTGTRVERQSFDIPMSIDAVDASVIRDAGPQVNLSEALQGVPGLSTCRTGRITRRICSSPRAVLGRARLLVCAASSCLRMAFQRRCPTDKAKCPISR